MSRLRPSNYDTDHFDVLPPRVRRIYETQNLRARGVHVELSCEDEDVIDETPRGDVAREKSRQERQAHLGSSVKFKATNPQLAQYDNLSPVNAEMEDWGTKRKATVPIPSAQELAFLSHLKTPMKRIADALRSEDRPLCANLKEYLREAANKPNVLRLDRTFAQQDMGAVNVLISEAKIALPFLAAYENAWPARVYLRRYVTKRAYDRNTYARRREQRRGGKGVV